MSNTQATPAIIQYDIPAYTRGKGDPPVTHDFEGRTYTYQHSNSQGAVWQAADGARLTVKRGVVTTFEHREHWCTLVMAIDGRPVDPVYGRRGQDIAVRMVRRWIAGDYVESEAS